MELQPIVLKNRILLKLIVRDKMGTGRREKI
jgi:hypothetical protein